MSSSNDKRHQTMGGDPEPGDQSNAGANRKYMNGAFLTVAGCLAVGLMCMKRGPQSAGASQALAAAGPVAFDAFLAGELPEIRSVDRALSRVDQVIDRVEFVPSKVQVPLMGLKVDPFHHDGDGETPAGLQDDLSASDSQEQARLAALQAVQSLRLESISRHGTSRACTINNVRYQEGQEAGGFLVEEIASNTVVVRRGVYRFELKPSL